MFLRLVRAGMGLTIIAAATPCPYFVRTVPVVLLNDGSNSIRLEVAGGPGAKAVVWKPPANAPLIIGGQHTCNQPVQSFTLHDNGTGIFTIENVQFDAASACHNLGQVSVTNGGMAGYSQLDVGSIVISTATGDTTLNIGSGYYAPLQVMEAQMLRVLDNVTAIDANSQRTAWVTNVRDDDLTIERGMSNWAPAITSQAASIAFNRYFTDAYDFRGLISTTNTPCDVGRTQGLHQVIHSTTTGNGENTSDFSPMYQTGPKLLGITYIANFIQGSPGVFYHETMHQWGAYLDRTQLNVSDTGGHWLGNSSINGALGGCPWVDNGNGTFSTGPRTLVDGDLELYVAGFLPASQVNPVYVAGAPVNNCNAGQAVPGPYRKVTVDDVIRVHGPRLPAADSTVKNYKYALLVTSQNRLLSPLEMTYYGRIAQVWEGSTVEVGSNPPLQWPVYTRGASRLSTVLDTWAGPLVRAANVTNAASGSVGAISPGEIIVLYGSRLGPTPLSGFTINDAGRFDTQSGGTRVLFDGTPAPMLYSSAGQVSGIVPYNVAGRVAVSVQVEYQGQLSPAISFPVALSAPAIFTQDQSGKGPGSIRNQDYSLNTADNPAPGGSVVQIYGTGEGIAVEGATDGEITAGLKSTVQAAAVTIGNVRANLQFAGPAPQAVAGLFQVNAFVPDGLKAGAQPVVVKFGVASSQTGVTVFVK